MGEWADDPHSLTSKEVSRAISPPESNELVRLVVASSAVITSVPWMALRRSPCPPR